MVSSQGFSSFLFPSSFQSDFMQLLSGCESGGNSRHPSPMTDRRIDMQAWPRERERSGEIKTTKNQRALSFYSFSFNDPVRGSIPIEREAIVARREREREVKFLRG